MVARRHAIPPSNLVVVNDLLNDAERMVRLTCEATGFARDLVARQFIQENASLGRTVWNELNDRGISPYTWSSALEDFYVETTAFLSSGDATAESIV